MGINDRLLCCWLLIITLPPTHHTVFAQEKGAGLPKGIQENLSRIDGKWHFVSNVAPDGRKCPDVVTGDLDGNGQTDYAVYIVASKGPADKHQRLIIYLKKKDQYSRHTLSREMPNTVMCLYKFEKGEEDYRYDAGEHFRYRYDTVGLFSEKAGYSYLYWRGRFYAVITSD